LSSSRKAQAIRVQALRDAGVADDLRARLQSSVGLTLATRDPATLALSALAQIVEQYHRIAGVEGVPEAPACNRQRQPVER